MHRAVCRHSEQMYFEVKVGVDGEEQGGRYLSSPPPHAPSRVTAEIFLQTYVTHGERWAPRTLQTPPSLTRCSHCENRRPPFFFFPPLLPWQQLLPPPPLARLPATQQVSGTHLHANASSRITA